MPNDTVNILAVGVGGQGIIRLSNILAQTAFKCGFDVKKSEIHGLSQRGGSVTSHIRWGEKVHAPVIMDGTADFVVALEELEALRYAHFLKPNGEFIINDYSILPATVIGGAAEYPRDIDRCIAGYGKLTRVPATKKAQELGNVRASNIILLGALSKRLDFAQDAWTSTITESFPEKFVQLNLDAFAQGQSMC